MTAATTGWQGWSRRHLVVLGLGLLAPVLVRALLLPTPGLTGDLDQFVRWVHGLATAPLGRAYDQNLSFPPVMVFVWAVLAAIEPAFRTVTDSGDAGIRALMKTPASLADLGLALGIAWGLRARPGWAVGAALGIALHPAVVDVSAWWGQYESLYVLPALVAWLLAAGGRPAWAAAALAVALMTKPQALPFVVPFTAWYLARFGLAASLRYAAIAVGVIVALWLPFLAAGGPAAYLRNLGEYQNGIFAVLSLRAWNPWWLVQEALGRGNFIADSAAVLGPISLRAVGLIAAGLLEAIVFLAVVRSPTPRRLALGLASATLVAFVALTTMHERYAYAALIFLAPLLPDRRVLAVWLAVGVVFTLNLLSAAPPSAEIAAALPAFGPVSVAGSLAMTALAGATVWLLLGDRLPAAAPDPAAKPDAVPAQVVG